MSSEKTSGADPVEQNSQNTSSLGNLCKFLAILGLLLFMFNAFLFNSPYKQYPDQFTHFRFAWPISPGNNTTPPNMTSATPLSLEHIAIGIVGLSSSWKHRKHYVESWWRPNVTRGYLFLDRHPTREFQPWPSSSPPYKVNEDITKLKAFRKFARPGQLRILHTTLEAIRLGNPDVRWYVMADDDTILFVDNLVKVLAKYDHTKLFYIGTNSECVSSNEMYSFDMAFGGAGSNEMYSFDMAFGGAGYVLSASLAEALKTKLDVCIDRYPDLYPSDYILHTCLADFGVLLTREKGFHQFDLRTDISGLLSAHPPTPLVSLHHLDSVDPIFPSMDCRESLNHLMKAVKFDQSRILQQTICYRMEKNWSFSTSWGYTIHAYENIYPRSVLQTPLETFKPWLKIFKPPLYMFTVRPLKRNSCETPHIFYFDSIDNTTGNYVVATYVRDSARNLPPCSASGNHSANSISEIHVFSSAITQQEAGVPECCDIEQTTNEKVAHIKLRACTKEEMIT